MKRALLNIAAFTLPVRPQHRNKLSVTRQELKSLLLIALEASVKPLETSLSFIIAIETISYSAYYPQRKPEK